MEWFSRKCKQTGVARSRRGARARFVVEFDVFDRITRLEPGEDYWRRGETGDLGTSFARHRIQAHIDSEIVTRNRPER